MSSPNPPAGTVSGATPASPASSLRGAQRRYLRGLAHDLDPVVHVGQKGLTPQVAAEVDRALEIHELIKVRLPGDRDERAALADALAAATAAERVGLVGGVLILYRRQPDPEKRQIELR
jgi:RNA-binding protein